MRNNLDELLKSLEQIRMTEYPDIPRDLIETIVKVQYENQDNRVFAKTEITNMIQKFIEERCSGD